MDRVKNESASRQLDGVHAEMPLSTRIAIVGAGPSGLAAALALTRLGYEQVTVLESQPTVGGMCASVVIEGRVYDLGGQVLARESSPTLRALMAEMQVEMEDMTQHRLARIDCSNGKYEDMKVGADYISLLPHTLKLQADAAETGKLGIHALSDLAHQPSDEYLRTNGVATGVPAAVGNGYTASGYGYPADMPYAYLHEFARTSMLGKIWRVKDGYTSFWEKVAASLPDVRCNAQVKSIDRSGDNVQICVCSGSQESSALEFDKLIMTGSMAYPWNNPTYRSLTWTHSGGEVTTAARSGILDYNAEELQLFAKVRTIEYYTTVLKISGLDLPVGFYYPNTSVEDPNTVGHPVAIQRFFADSDIYLFWSYGSAEVPGEKVTQLLLQDVQSMGGKTDQVILQRKWNYFPHVSCSDMADGFYDKLDKLQGKRNTYYLGGLLAFELTERNVSFAFNLIRRCFGTTEERQYVKKLIPLPPLANSPGRERSYEIEVLDELPGVEFPDLPSLDAYLAYYAKHKVLGDRILYTWLDDQGREADKRTFADLNGRANIIAHRLLTGKTPLKAGDRVLLLHPPGLDFIEAFFGCLRARVLPVPLIPPDPTQRGGQALAKVENVAKACNAKAFLSTSAYHTAVRAASVRNMLSASNKAVPSWPSLPWYHTDSWTQQGRSPWTWFFNSKISSNGSSSPRTALTAIERESVHGKPPFSPKSSTREKPAWLTPAKVAKTESLGLQVSVASPKSVLLTHEDGRSDEDEKQPQDFDFGPEPNPSDICFLQFTSGSTGDSKGVMISHGGLIHNVKLMHSEYRSTSKTVLVSWLPQYHDMGLIGGLFTALVSGATAVLFSPTTFIRKPMLWLETMDKYKCTHSAGPNFAFELIVKRYEQLKAAGKAPAYNLSSLRFLMASAEPLRHKTLQTFLEILHSAGLREQVLAPGYGLAENCVFVCVAYGKEKPILVDWQGRVCCGYTHKGHNGVDIRIVDPRSFEEKVAGVEGEIWVSSPSAGVGYWGQKELGEQTFSNTLRNSNAEDRCKKFLRTGDLGRVIDGKLFITGRIKDVIILRGRNFYPADIEKVVENSSDALRPGCCAVFSAPNVTLQDKGVLQSGATEDAGVVVVAELRDEKKIDPELPALIKASVAQEYGIEVAHVTLIKPRTIAKTTSGKIRRIECLKRFTENKLETVNVPTTPTKNILRRWESAPLSRKGASSRLQIPHNCSVTMRSEQTLPSKKEIINFLIQIVAERTSMPRFQVSADEPLTNYNFDSVSIVWAAQKLSDFLGVHIAAIDIYTAGCISELAETSDSLVRKARSRPSTPRMRDPVTPTSRAADSSRQPSKRSITQFLLGLVSERTGFSIREISTTENLSSYNIDSVGVVWAAQKLSDHLGVHIAAIDVYTAGCIADLAESAEALMQKAGRASSPEQNPSSVVNEQISSSDVSERETITDHEISYSLEPSLARQIGITFLQIIGIIYIGALLLLPASFIYGQVTRITSDPTALQTVLAVAIVPLGWLAYLAVIPIIISVFGTCLLQPNFTFGVPIPLWSVRYAKWWTMYRLQEFASNTLAVHLKGTIFLTWWYRLLGAHIGEGVQLETTDITDPGLLFVGNNVVVEEGATVQCHEVQTGIVFFQPVRINSDASVGAFSVIQRGTVVDVGGAITPLGKTEVGQRVYATQASMSLHKVQCGSSTGVGLRQAFGLYLVGLVSTAAAIVAYLPFLWSAAKLEIFTEAERESNSLATGCIIFALAANFPWAVGFVAPALAFQHSSFLLHLLLKVVERRKLITLLFSFGGAYFIYGLTLAVFTVALKWILVGKLKVDKAANLRSTSEQFFRLWLVHTLLRFTHIKFVSQLSGTEAICIYLRSLGAKIGKLASIRGVNALVDPDLITLGSGCHLGDFARIITSVHHTDSSVSLGKVTVGAGCIVGAQSVVMPGAILEDQSWLGALSVAPTNSVLQSGGVYVGVDSLVRIYQKNANEVRVLSNSESMEERDYRIEQMDPLYQKIVANLSASIGRTTLSVDARYFHRLGVGGKGTIKFLDTLPGLPQHEIFAPGHCYPVLVRHSNSLSGDDDARMDARGASLRILQPDSGDNVEAALLDLTLKTGRGFYARNLIEFVSYLTKNQDARLKHVEKFPHTAKMIWDSLKDCNSYAEMHYYSNLVRVFRSKDGECYVKFKLRPVDPSYDEDHGRVRPSSVLPPETGAIPRSESDNRPLRFLAEDFKTRVTSPEGVKYIFQVQLRPISSSVKDNEDALDCTRSWDEKECPYIDVAELHLTEILDDLITENIRFNPRNGPSSIGMIPARSAAESASMDHGRSLAYDIAQYLRNGIPLPPAWQKLLQKADQQVTMGGGCPAMSGHLPANVQVLPVGHKKHVTKEGHGVEGRFQAWELATIRFFQPLLQTIIPIMLMSFASYPSLLALAFLGSKFGQIWIQWLLPVAFLVSGIVFAGLSILARWAIVGQTRDGDTNELWGIKSLCDTIWQSINLSLSVTFMALGKGSLLMTCYLRLLGASISSSAYMDTEYALNPDLLSIGAGAAVGHNALLFGHLYEGGKVGFKSNSIGNCATIGTRALVLPGLKMQDDSQLAALRLGMKDEVIEAYH